jgi:hypothetical protein
MARLSTRGFALFKFSIVRATISCIQYTHGSFGKELLRVVLVELIIVFLPRGIILLHRFALPYHKFKDIVQRDAVVRRATEAVNGFKCEPIRRYNSEFGARQASVPIVV